MIAAGTDVIVNASGKVKEKGSLKVDGVRYQITDYAAVEEEEED